ncbi:hypothetical protein shim_39930 [Shimia sp. SK013]|uniref:DUF1203 domain-containing protein n=1 Tax=Shimia sp. SK013 TaxID=1389006 RepID=UPI0006B54C0B|nr:DUF1203 domain-containing protein [Shimia sp. SK013]KPA20034.1 hypothetical protein shim_39930 [Shimia sp. SK013]
MLQFIQMPTPEVRAYQRGGPDAYGRVPERQASDGAGAPCRHCLKNIPKGAGMLVLAHCPFPKKQPYAETGPIFLCADECAAHDDFSHLPDVLGTSPTYLIKGYSEDHRIVYGTGAIVEKSGVVTAAQDILAHDRVAYVHARSARNNCYLLRIEGALPPS